MVPRLQSLKVRLLACSILTTLLAAGIGYGVFRVVEKLQVIEFETLRERLIVFFFLFILLSTVLNLCILSVVLNPVRRLTQRLRSFIEGENIDKINPADYPEMRGLVEATIEFVNSVEREKSVASMIRQVSRKRAMMAEKDAMTGLYNKNYLLTMVNGELSRSKVLGDSLSLVMLDIDNFKHYNDTNGHPAGDEVLIEIANILRENTRDLDLCARFGGEEFMVVLPKTPLRIAEEIAERIRTMVQSASFPHEDKQPLGMLTASFGVASFPDHATIADDLVRKTDVALYAAKRAGKNRVCVYAKSLEQKLSSTTEPGDTPPES